MNWLLDQESIDWEELSNLYRLARVLEKSDSCIYHSVKRAQRQDSSISDRSSQLLRSQLKNLLAPATALRPK